MLESASRGIWIQLPVIVVIDSTSSAPMQRCVWQKCNPEKGKSGASAAPIGSGCTEKPIEPGKVVKNNARGSVTGIHHGRRLPASNS
ncbi:MAG TPA: hypothetical protein VMW70_04360 [Burkholderiales bacterium]|nr:hypothetical protein [Burkholderiales bacterium]